MREENKKLTKILHKTIKKLEKYYGDDDKLESLKDISLELLLRELKKEKIVTKVVSNIPESVAKKVRIKDGFIGKEKVDYSWQDGEPKRNMVILPFENQDEFALGAGSSTLSLALAQEKVGMMSVNKTGTFEVLVYNHDQVTDLKLIDSFEHNIEALRQNMLEESKISLLNNNLNKNFVNQVYGMDLKRVEETGNGVQPVLRVAMRDTHFFRGYVSYDVAQWIAVFCIAAGLKCQIRQSYLEEAIGADLNWIRDPNVERGLSMHKGVSPNLSKIWEESDWCKSREAIAFVLPLSSWVDSILNKTTSYENEIVAYGQQIFLLRRN